MVPPIVGLRQLRADDHRAQADPQTRTRPLALAELGTGTGRIVQVTIRYSKEATRAMWAIDTACGHKTRSCGWCFAYVPARKDGSRRTICLHCGKKQPPDGTQT